jgi:hypothetical protein
MRCKQGDIAVIVSPYADLPMRGMTVHVTRRAMPWQSIRAKNGDGSMCVPNHGPGWFCDGHDGRLPCIVSDDCLFPLRDPGEDAKDETLQWKEVPTKQKEPA